MCPLAMSNITIDHNDVTILKQSSLGHSMVHPSSYRFSHVLLWQWSFSMFVEVLYQSLVKSKMIESVECLLQLWAMVQRISCA